MKIMNVIKRMFGSNITKRKKTYKKKTAVVTWIELNVFFYYIYNILTYKKKFFKDFVKHKVRVDNIPTASLVLYTKNRKLKHSS